MIKNDKKPCCPKTMFQAVGQKKKRAFIFTPTPNEYIGVKKHIEGLDLKNISINLLECGMGKINAAFSAASAILPEIARGEKPDFIISAGTCGSLSKSLSEGDVIASASATISDWVMEEDKTKHFTLYGCLDYKKMTPTTAEEMAIECRDPIVRRLLEKLSEQNFKTGRLMTSDNFVAALKKKLTYGTDFNCLACDMESGVFAHCAEKLLGGIAFFNLRVVADTLDENFDDYCKKEIDMVEILGKKCAEALIALDELIEDKKNMR